METLYMVSIDGTSETHYFHTYENAHNYLFDIYRLTTMKYETKEQQELAKTQLFNYHFIEGIGYIYEYEFEDEI